MGMGKIEIDYHGLVRVINTNRVDFSQFDHISDHYEIFIWIEFKILIFLFF